MRWDDSALKLPSVTKGLLDHHILLTVSRPDTIKDIIQTKNVMIINQYFLEKIMLFDMSCCTGSRVETHLHERPSPQSKIPFTKTPPATSRRFLIDDALPLCTLVNNDTLVHICLFIHVCAQGHSVRLLKPLPADIDTSFMFNPVLGS